MWLMNMGFAGGGTVVTTTVLHKKRGSGAGRLYHPVTYLLAVLCG